MHNRNTIPHPSRVLSIAFLALVLWLAGCVPVSTRATTQPIATTQLAATATVAYPPLTLHLSGDKIPINTVADLCHYSLVADVVVKALGQPHWNTPTGARPDGPLDDIQVAKHGYEIYTPLVFSQMRVFVDHRSQTTREYVSDGGQVGQDQIWNDELPQLTSGSRYVAVFLPSLDAQTEDYTEKILFVYEAFPVDSQGVVLFKPQTIEQGVVTQKEQKFALSDMEQQLASCK
ncbi:MAG TPA: hypothetical protein VH540_10950 [Ktedonobacterales bacterium]